MSLIDNIEFYEGEPSKEDLIRWSSNRKHNIIVLDDLMMSVSNNEQMANFFAFILIIWTSASFWLSKSYTLAENSLGQLNSKNVLLFKNCRDEQQIHRLASQLMPGQTKYFIDSYKKATQPMFGYLLVDISPRGNDQYKLRTLILPGENTIVYRPVK